jgi:predicted PurR-regulated permease PerM
LAKRNDPTEKKKPEPSDENKDLLDFPEFAKQVEQAHEEVWEERPNAFLEKHPYACGYLFIAFIVVLFFATHLMTLAISFLFLYLVSDFITNDVRRVVKVVPKVVLFSVLYVAVVSILIVLSYKTIPNVIKQAPAMAQQLQTQAIIQFETLNQNYDVARYVDPNEVRRGIVEATTKSLGFFASKFTALYTGFIYFIFALVINLLLYHRIDKIDAVFARKGTGLMSFLYRFVQVRIRVFYFYFKRVMGGQIIISAVNTGISTIAIVGLGLPRPFLLISIVFFAGLFPVVGNLISNTILTATAFVAIGWWGAAVCLGLLVGIHKLEYFLNSRIIGEIVHLPMVITLTALVVAEVLLGIIGLMLAIPLVLFVRHEMEHIPGLKGKPGEALKAIITTVGRD